MSSPYAHQCQPPYLARVGNCDCSRCCATGHHEPGCISSERSEQSECVCPDEAEYHHEDCPEA